MKAFKRVFSYLKYEKKNMIIAILAVFIETVFELIIPLIMSWMISSGVKAYINASNSSNQELMNSSMKVIIISAILIAVCAIMSLINGWFYSHFAAKAGARFGALIREAQFMHIQEYSFKNLDQFEPSSLVTRVINDSQILQNTITQTMRPIVRAPIMLVLGIAFTFYYSWKLALIFLVLSPILALVIILVLRKVGPKYQTMQTDLDGLNGKIQENLVAIRVIKTFVREPYECHEFDKVNDTYRNTVTSTFSLSNLISPFFQVMMYTSTILFLLLGGQMIINGTLDEGELTGILSYVMQTFNSLIMAANVFINVAKTLASVYRVNEVLTVTPDIKDGTSKIKVQKGDIEFKDVSFKYKEGTGRDVLSHVSFKIEHGKTLGIIGSTGSAKSTLVSLIPRLYDATEGEVLVDGINVNQYDLYDLRSSISMVLQKPVLFEGTIKDNLRWGKKDMTDDEVKNAVSVSCCDEFLSNMPLGLDTEVGEGGNALSGGQKQRVSIARALIKNPKVLILDDATSAVDTKTEKKIRVALNELKDTTKIIISQRILSVMDADLVLILDNGKINEINTPKELLAHNSIYQDLYDRQLKGVNLDE